MAEFKQLNRKEYQALSKTEKKAFQDSFVEYYLPMVENAVEMHKKGEYKEGATNLDPKLILAQMIKESEWGVSGLSFGHNNFGGLKASDVQIEAWKGGKTPTGRKDISGWTSMGTHEDFKSEKEYLAYKKAEEKKGNKTYLTKRMEGDQEIWTANLGQPFLTFDTPQKGIDHQVRWWAKFGGIKEGDDAVAQIKKIQDAGYATSVGYQDSIINMYYKPLTILDDPSQKTTHKGPKPLPISKDPDTHIAGTEYPTDMEGRPVGPEDQGPKPGETTPTITTELPKKEDWEKEKKKEEDIVDDTTYDAGTLDEVTVSGGEAGPDVVKTLPVKEIPVEEKDLKPITADPIVSKEVLEADATTQLPLKPNYGDFTDSRSYMKAKMRYLKAIEESEKDGKNQEEEEIVKKEENKKKKVKKEKGSGNIFKNKNYPLDFGNEINYVANENEAETNFIFNPNTQAVSSLMPGSITTTTTTAGTDEDETESTPFVLPSAKQALENSKNPKYVAALEKQGYTVEQYLKDPQGVLNEISKKSDLESNLEEAPAPPIFSMGAENVEIETPTEEIVEIEEDDDDIGVETETASETDAPKTRMSVLKSLVSDHGSYKVDSYMGNTAYTFEDGTTYTDVDLDLSINNNIDLKKLKKAAASKPKVIDVGNGFSVTVGVDGEYVEGESPGDLYNSKKAFVNSRENQPANQGTYYNNSKKHVNNADEFFDEITTMKRKDASGNSVIRGLINLAFKDIPHKEELDFGEFEEAMKYEILNIVPPEIQKRVRLGDMAAFRNAGYTKEDVVTMAKINVIEKQQKIFDQSIAKINEATTIFNEDRVEFEDRYADFNTEKEDVDKDLRAVKDRYGDYFFTASGREAYFPSTIKRQMTNEDKDKLFDINGRIKDLDVEYDYLLSTQIDLTKRQTELLNQSDSVLKAQTDLWEGLLLDPNIGISKQSSFIRSAENKKFDEWYNDKFTSNFFGATIDIAATGYQEIYRYKGLYSLLSNPYTAGALAIGTGIAGLYDFFDSTPDEDRYSAMDQWFDFLGGMAFTNIVPTNNIDVLFKGVDKPSGNVFKDLTNPEAYNFSTYTVGKTAANLFGYTRVLALKTMKYGKTGHSLIGGAQQMGKRMAQKSTQFNKGMNKLGLGKMGDDIVASLHKNWKPTKGYIAKLRMIEANQKMLLLGNIADGRANGLSGMDAFVYGNATALATGISQLIMPDINFFKTLGGKNLLKGFVKDLKKKGIKSFGETTKQSFVPGAMSLVRRQAVREFGVNFLKEHAEEQADLALNGIVKGSMLANYSQEITDVNAQQQVLVGTTILAGGLGLGRGASVVMNTKTYLNAEIYKHGSKILDQSVVNQKELKKKYKYYNTLFLKRPENGKWKAKRDIFLEEYKREKEAYDNVYATLQAYNSSGKFATVGMIDNLVEKNKLIERKNKLTKKDKTVNEEEINSINEKIKALDVKIKESTPNEWKKELYQNSIRRGKKLLGNMGISIKVYEAKNQEEYNKHVMNANAEIQARNEKASEENKKKGKKKKIKPQKIKDFKGVGTILYDDYSGDHIIIINKDAMNKSDNYGVGVHEIFHAVMRNTVKGKGGAQKVKALSYLLRQELLKNPSKYGFIMGSKYVTGKFASYEKQVESMEWDEMFTVLSEGMAQGDVAISNGTLTKLHSVVRRTLRNVGINIDFFPGTNPAREMMNFIKDYNDELLDGDRENFSPGMRKIIKNGLNIKVDMDFAEKASEEEKKKKLEQWDKNVAFSSLSTRAGRTKKNIYDRPEIIGDLKLKESTRKIVEENDRIRKELLETRIVLEDGTFEYDEDLRNDLVLNNMALVTALSDFAAKNPKIMGLEEGKRISFTQFQSGFSNQLLSLSQSYDPALVPFGAYLNMLLPRRFGDVLKAEQRGAIEGSVSIDNEKVGQIPDAGTDTDTTPDDFDAADRHVAPKKNVAKEIGLEEEVDTIIREGLSELKSYRELKGKENLSEKEQEQINKLERNLMNKHMLKIDDKTGEIVDPFDDMSISNIEGVTYKILARESGVDVEKLNPRSKTFLANLRKEESKAGSNEVRSAQQFIVKVGPGLILSAIFNEGHTRAFKSTNMPGVLLKFGYNKGSKRIKNNYPQYKKPNLSEKEFLEYLGIYRVDGKYDFRVDRNTSARLLAVLSLMDRTITNQQYRKNLEATGDLDVRLKNSLEDGLSNFAESIFYIKNPDLQESIDLKMPELGIKVQEIDKNWTKTQKINYLRSVFTEDGTLTKKQANEFLGQMFNESGVIMQYIYREEILTSQGVKNIESFEDFAKKWLGKGNIHEGLIEFFGLKNKDGKAPSVSELFDVDSVDRARINVADFIENGILKEWRKRIGTKKEISVDEVLDMIYMYEQENATAYKINDGAFVYEPGTNTKIKKKPSKSTKRQQFFAANKEDGGAKLDFRLWVWNFIGEDFKAKMTEEQKAAFTSDTSLSYSSLDLMPKDGKGVIGRMVRTIKSSKGEKLRKGATTYDQEEFSKESELAQKLTIDKILFFTDLLNKNLISEHDFVLQMVSLNSNPTTSLRRGAEVIGIMDGIIDSNGDFLLGELNNDNIRFEHSKPAIFLLMSLIKIAQDPKVKNKRVAMDLEYVDYKVSIINKDADGTLDTAGFKYLMYDGYESGNIDGWVGRMFNDYNLGFDFVKPIRLIEDVVKGKMDGVVYGETHNVASDLLPKSKNEIDQDVKINELTRLANSINYNRESRGMSTFDFDETLIIDGKNFVTAIDPVTGEKTKISSAEWPTKGPEFQEKGFKFDFKDFVNVRGGTDGPLLQKMKNQIKKFGPNNVFVLTARMQESDVAIHGWLKSKGINIPMKNITGLGNSTGEAKAMWMLDKFTEGYNDMYFVDDALSNVKAVKNVLDQLDIKSKVQQVISSKSIDFDRDFNEILEESTGTEASKRFSDAKARRRGEGKGKFNIFIPPGAEDFLGLIYQFLGKGKLGEKQFKFFKKTLIDPLNRAYRDLNKAKQAIANDFAALKKKMPDVKKILFNTIGDSDFTYNDAIRVYLWDKAGFEIPGISKSDQKELVETVKNDARLKAFADMLSILSRQKDGYVPPTVTWLSEDIRADLKNATDKVGRKQFFAEFLENMKIIFSPENMNKIEAIYGKAFREALEDMLYRIENGTNRSFGSNKLVNDFMNWINGSIGTTMFFNARSAVLQTLSMVNFINFQDNNIFAAAKAFANQKQFWADFIMIFNSDMLKQRRSGLNIDVNASELTDYISSRGSGANKYKAAINYLLSKGFLPTQIADSFAIAMGGASFYRNRFNKYVKEGMSISQAKEKAFQDFQAIAEETQQSARPDMISQQQASVLGRIILAFQNTPMQYARLMKKAMLDLVNGRGDAKANVSRIIYYGAVQNIIFYSLQTALFAMMFDDDDDDEKFDKKKERVLNGSIDSILRGMGVQGAIVSTLKNMIRAFYKEQQKSFNKDESAVIMEMVNLSPPLGIKLRKIRDAERTLRWEKDLVEEIPFYNLKNPAWEAGFSFTQALTNVPLSRLHQKTVNMSDAISQDMEAWQRIALMMGWTKWNLGIEDKSKKRTSSKKRSTRSRRKISY